MSEEAVIEVYLCGVFAVEQVSHEVPPQTRHIPATTVPDAAVAMRTTHLSGTAAGYRLATWVSRAMAMPFPGDMVVAEEQPDGLRAPVTTVDIPDTEPS